MGLNSSTSFASSAAGGGGATGTAKWERPASGQAIVTAYGSTNGSVFYTVPAGYFFRGYVIHDNGQYSPEFNNGDIPKCFMAMSRDHGENVARGNSQSNDIILPPGTTIESGYQMTTEIVGNLYAA